MQQYPRMPARPTLARVLREWGRIGCLGFGGPPAHIALLRELCVERRGYLRADEFESAIAVTGLLPGPASTQMAIFTAWRVRGAAGALAGGLAFIVPGLVAIVALAALFLQSSPPDWVIGAGLGASAAVPAVALQAGTSLLRPSWANARGRRRRWILYLAAGAAAAATAGPWVVVVLLGCGAVEAGVGSALLLPVATAGAGGLLSLAWVAFKVGALSYGGGFVIVPLMQSDAVHHFHWLTNAKFLDAVALGQITPGPVVHTVAAVGYAAHGVGGALLAATVAFAPSFAFVLAGGPRFDRVRDNRTVRAFLAGAGPAAIGAILGSAIPLAGALHHTWQAGVLLVAFVVLVLLRRSVVTMLVAAAVVGVVVA